MKIKMRYLKSIISITAMLSVGSANSLEKTTANLDNLDYEVNSKAGELMSKYQIPGMAFGITIDGQARYFNYGLADKELSRPVTENTIFELGSISKTFAATLASYAELQGKLSFEEKVSNFIPELQGSVIGETPLIQLATYTAGGLPLQFPEDVTNESMLKYYRDWTPVFPQGTRRLYSNPSIGLFGYISALSMNGKYADFIENEVQKKLAMNNTFINVPSNKMEQYAWGYNNEGHPVRVSPGVLDTEAYGVKSTSRDMISYIESNMKVNSLNDEDMQSALNKTKTGFYKSSTFIQGLAWEMYPYPVSLDAILEGNSNDNILKDIPVNWLEEPKVEFENVWINKTGSTGGFGAYIAYIPSKKVGVIILANKAYPNAERIKAAYHIINIALNENQ